MKAVFAFLIAAAILWLIDDQFNRGRYAYAVRQVVSGITGGRL